MFVALIASAAAFVPVPVAPVAPAVPAPGAYYAVSYASAAPTPVYVVRARQPQRRSDSALNHLALHAAVTGVVAASFASLGLLGTARSVASTSSRSRRTMMVETETKEAGILDKLRG